MEPGQDHVAAAGFDPEPSAVATARGFVRDTLISWGLPGRDDVVTDAVLLASELVTNAIVHAGTAVELTCRFNGATVEISVLDRHPARVIPDPPAAAADVARPSGRGLLLPAALSSSWGVTYTSAAKMIWFRLGPDVPAAGPDIAESLAAADQPGGRPAEHDATRDLLQLGYDELLGHAVTLAREAVAADAAYALIADEDGELRMRAATGRGVTQPRVGEAAAATASTPATRPSTASGTVSRERRGSFWICARSAPRWANWL